MPDFNVMDGVFQRHLARLAASDGHREIAWDPRGGQDHNDAELDWMEGEPMIRINKSPALVLFMIFAGHMAMAQNENGADVPANSFGKLLIGPVPGLTSVWHLAPAAAAVPISTDSAGTTLQFKYKAPHNARVTWQGAVEEQKGEDGTSVARCALQKPGRYVVSVSYTFPDGSGSEVQCVLEAVAIDPERIQVSTTVAVDPVVLDDGDVNKSTYRHYLSIESIASLRRLSSDYFVTSTYRTVNINTEIDPPEFAPMIEWRLDDEAPSLGNVMSRRLNREPRIYSISAGPTANPRSLTIETYSARITSHISDQDIVPTGSDVVFTAETDPPGYEDMITWLASTKYGYSDPVMAVGPEFKVRFEETWGLSSYTGKPFQWLGVKADKGLFNQDQKMVEIPLFLPGERNEVGPGEAGTVAFDPKRQEGIVARENAGNKGAMAAPIVVKTVDSRGVPMGVETTISNNAGTDPAIAFDLINETYLVVWDSPGNGILGSTTGSESMESFPEFSISSINAVQRRPQVVARPEGGFLVIWETGPAADPAHADGIFGRRIDADESSDDAEEFRIDNEPGRDPMRASVDDGNHPDDDRHLYLAVWDRRRGPEDDRREIAGHFFESPESTGIEFVISDPATESQIAPHVAFDSESDSFLVAWCGTNEINVRLVQYDEDDLLSDQVRVPAAVEPESCRPRVVAVNGKFLVMWSEPSTISGDDQEGAILGQFFLAGEEDENNLSKRHRVHTMGSRRPKMVTGPTPERPEAALTPGNGEAVLLVWQDLDGESTVFDQPFDWAADLSLVVTDAPSSAVSGAELNYSVTVRNRSPANARDVVVDHTPSAGLTIVEKPDYCEEMGSLLRCSHALIAGTAFGLEPLEYTLTGRVDNDFTGEVSLQSRVSSANVDPIDDNNSMTTTTIVDGGPGPGGLPDLNLELTTLSPQPVRAGGALNYRLTVTNTGSADAENAGVSVTPPSGIQFDANACRVAAAGKLDCDLGAIAEGDAMSLVLTGDVDASFPASIVTLSAEVVSPTENPPANATVETVITSPRLLLQGIPERFEVRVRLIKSGEYDDGWAYPQSDDTGFFWFFSPENIELVVKVLDGRAINEHFWVFYGALSEEEYEITVTDLQTSESKMYKNEKGNVCGSRDTQAFPSPFSGAIPAGEIQPFCEAPTCAAGSGAICLLEDRFIVEARWRDQEGQEGAATAVPCTNATDEAGFFWFFNESNIELAVKILDARDLPGGDFWIFYAGISDVEYWFTVTDAMTGKIKDFHNDPGDVCGGSDTNTF